MCVRYILSPRQVATLKLLFCSDVTGVRKVAEQKVLNVRMQTVEQNQFCTLPCQIVVVK